MNILDIFNLANQANLKFIVNNLTELNRSQDDFDFMNEYLESLINAEFKENYFYQYDHIINLFWELSKRTSNEKAKHNFNKIIKSQFFNDFCSFLVNGLEKEVEEEFIDYVMVSDYCFFENFELDKKTLYLSNMLPYLINNPFDLKKEDKDIFINRISQVIQLEYFYNLCTIKNKEAFLLYFESLIDKQEGLENIINSYSFYMEDAIFSEFDSSENINECFIYWCVERSENQNHPFEAEDISELLSILLTIESIEEHSLFLKRIGTYHLKDLDYSDIIEYDFENLVKLQKILDLISEDYINLIEKGYIEEVNSITLSDLDSQTRYFLIKIVNGNIDQLDNIIDYIIDEELCDFTKKGVFISEESKEIIELNHSR